ncbi:MAG: YegP family protein [Clostridia bacterium]|nr:YegP family protein [Clostridia bacterium]
MGKFIIKDAKNGGFTISLKARNGEVIGVGGEVLNTLTTAKNSIESIIKNAQAAEIEDQTVAEVEAKKHPKFEVYCDKSGEFRFRLKARNGEPILSSEGYKYKRSCLNGIASVKKNVVDAKIVDPDSVTGKA